MKLSQEARCLSYGLKLLDENITDKLKANRLKVSLIKKTIATYKTDKEKTKFLTNFLQSQNDPSCKEFVYNNVELFSLPLKVLLSALNECTPKKKEGCRNQIRRLVIQENSFYELSELLRSEWDEDLAAFCLASYKPLDREFLIAVSNSNVSKRIDLLRADYVYVTSVI